MYIGNNEKTKTKIICVIERGIPGRIMYRLLIDR